MPLIFKFYNLNSPTMHLESCLKSEIKGESSHTDNRCYTGAGVGEKGGRAWRKHHWNVIFKDWVSLEYKKKSINEEECIKYKERASRDLIFLISSCGPGHAIQFNKCSLSTYYVPAMLKASTILACSLDPENQSQFFQPFFIVLICA